MGLTSLFPHLGQKAIIGCFTFVSEEDEGGISAAVAGVFGFSFMGGLGIEG